MPDIKITSHDVATFDECAPRINNGKDNAIEKSKAHSGGRQVKALPLTPSEKQHMKQKLSTVWREIAAQKNLEYERTGNKEVSLRKIDNFEEQLKLIESAGFTKESEQQLTNLLNNISNSSKSNSRTINREIKEKKLPAQEKSREIIKSIHQLIISHKKKIQNAGMANPKDSDLLSQYEQRLTQLESNYVESPSIEQLLNLMEEVNKFRPQKLPKPVRQPLENEDSKGRPRPESPEAKSQVKVSEFLPEYSGQLQSAPSINEARNAIDTELVFMTGERACQSRTVSHAKHLRDINFTLLETLQEGEFTVESIQSFLKHEISRTQQKLDKEYNRSLADLEYFDSENVKFTVSEAREKISVLHQESKNELEQLLQWADTLKTKEQWEEVKSDIEQQNNLLNRLYWAERGKLDKINERLSQMENPQSGSFGSVVAVDGGLAAGPSSDEKLHKRYALKQQAISNKTALQRLMNESEMARLSPSPIKLHAGEQSGDNHYWMLMDDGGVTLHKLVISDCSKDISDGAKRAIMKSVAEQLLRMHQQNIVHRDIKLENIMINPSTGVVGLIDYGYAVKEESGVYSGKHGTPQYVAPEIISDLPYTNKIDVFSLGVIFYELITEELSELNMYNDEPNVVQRKINRMLNVIDDLYGSDSMEYDLLACMLTYDPDQRISMEEVVNHPRFQSGKKSYAELNILHRDAISKMARMEKNNQDDSNEYEELCIDIKALQSAIRWHDLESQKNSYIKAGERSDDDPIISDIKAQQELLERKAGSYLYA